MRAVFLLFFLFLYLTDRVRAQVIPANSLDDVYTPPKGSLLDTDKYKVSGNTRASGQTREPGSEPRNQIGMAFPMIFRNVAVVTYQRLFTRHLALEAGLGLSYGGDNLINGTLKAIRVDNPDYLTQPALYQHSNSHTLRTYNPYLHLTGKFFLEGDPIDGSYIGFHYRYYRNDLRYSGSSRAEAMDDITDAPDYKITMQSFSLIYGILSGSSSGSYIHDLYVGAGWRNCRYGLFPVAEWEAGGYSSYSFDQVRAISPVSVGRGGFGYPFLMVNYILNFSF